MSARSGWALVGACYLTRPRLPTQSIAETPHFTDALSGYLASSIAEATRFAYASDLKAYLGQGGSIPTTPLGIANYLVDQAQHVSPVTLARRLVAIGREHVLRGLPNPCSDALVRMTMRGIRRRHGRPPRQVAPLLAEQLRAIVSVIPATLRGNRDKALLLIGFAGSFRRSELVSLTREQVCVVAKGIEIVLTTSKTDQEHRGRVVAIPLGMSDVTCPVRALQEWITGSALCEGHLFRSISKDGRLGRLPLSAQTVALIVKNYVAKLGLDPRSFSGHSLRAGLATSAAAVNVSASRIRAQTGHRSDAMLARYVREADLFTGNAANGLL